MICPCNEAFISFVLQQTVIARKYVCIRTPLELGKLQKVKEKKKFRKRLFLGVFETFLVHEAGLEVYIFHFMYSNPSILAK